MSREVGRVDMDSVLGELGRLRRELDRTRDTEPWVWTVEAVIDHLLDTAESAARECVPEQSVLVNDLADLRVAIVHELGES